MLCNNIPQRQWLKCSHHDDLSWFFKVQCLSLPGGSISISHEAKLRQWLGPKSHYYIHDGNLHWKDSVRGTLLQICMQFLCGLSSRVTSGQPNFAHVHSSLKTYISAHTASLHILLGKACSKVYPGSGGGNIHFTSWWRLSSSHWTKACFDVPIYLGNQICHVELHRSPTFVKLASTIIWQGRIIDKFQCLFQVYKFN